PTTPPPNNSRDTDTSGSLAPSSALQTKPPWTSPANPTGPSSREGPCPPPQWSLHAKPPRLSGTTSRGEPGPPPRR
ncbi:hypothetical protein T484DRAFT_1566132, partial [Baffinella frigidus]